MKFCEYCGSENRNYALRCHSCTAPFTIRAVRKPDMEQGQEQQPTAGPFLPPGAEQMLASILPIIIITACIMWPIMKVQDYLHRRKERKGEGFTAAPPFKGD